MLVCPRLDLGFLILRSSVRTLQYFCTPSIKRDSGTSQALDQSQQIRMAQYTVVLSQMYANTTVSWLAKHLMGEMHGSPQETAAFHQGWSCLCQHCRWPGPPRPRQPASRQPSPCSHSRLAPHSLHVRRMAPPPATFSVPHLIVTTNAQNACITSRLGNSTCQGIWRLDLI